MRAIIVGDALQAAQFLITNFWLILIICTIGYESLRYLAYPQGDYFKFMVVNSALFLVRLPIPLRGDDRQLQAFLEMLGMGTVGSNFLTTDFGLVTIGIINIVKIVTFLTLASSIIVFIWRWNNVLKNMASG